MSSSRSRTRLPLALLFGLATQATLAAQPPDPTPSDVKRNTAGGGNALLNLDGGFNETAFGDSALYSTVLSASNTAVGTHALFADTTGSANTALGTAALSTNTTASNNTAVGAHALYANTTGNRNTGTGFDALGFNREGVENTADGASALGSNVSGSQNTASGNFALYTNSSGSNNTASGSNALLGNTSGSDNTASGYQAMFVNDVGSRNVAVGVRALFFNSGKGNVGLGYQAGFGTQRAGSYNLAAGYDALHHNSSGSYNIALGYRAGYALTTGTQNIDIGNPGIPDESATTRIGTPGVQKAAYIAGVAGVPLAGGSPVIVTSSGQLGTVLSSARYKDDVRDMGEQSAKLIELRPVSFRYKSDAARQTQYGLIAEEVAEIYPELVVRGPDGTVESVQYHQLIPMLLNELQKQRQDIQTLQADNAALRSHLAAERSELLIRLTRLETQSRAEANLARR